MRSWGPSGARSCRERPARARSRASARRAGWFAVAAGIALGLVAALLPPAGAQSSELEGARQRAARSADAFAEAEVELDAATDRVAATEAELAAVTAAYDQLAQAVAVHLVEQYVRAGAGGVPLVADDLNTQVRAEALSRLATQRADDRSDELRQLRQDLDRKGADLRRQRKAARDRAAEMAELRTALLNELKELEAIEAERADAERQAEIASRQAAAAEAAAQAAASDEGSGGSGGSGGSYRPVVPVDWLCPITGAYAYSDTWGDARSGGRRHRGTDIFADYGTPVVAVVDGQAVDYGWDSGGGNGVFLLGDDGNRYYYAHLDEFGQLGRVSQGDVVGYVGDTGNASGTPHLHFEIHPGGSGWTNPYPTLIQYC